MWTILVGILCSVWPSSEDTGKNSSNRPQSLLDFSSHQPWLSVVPTRSGVQNWLPISAAKGPFSLHPTPLDIYHSNAMLIWSKSFFHFLQAVQLKRSTFVWSCLVSDHFRWSSHSIHLLSSFLFLFSQNPFISDIFKNICYF